MSEYSPVAGRTVMDASGAHILPAWCDSHTHLVHAASREKGIRDAPAWKIL